MSSLNNLAKGVRRTISANSPTILTALGVTGVLSTAFLTGKAAFRAADIIRAEEATVGVTDDNLILFKERFRLTWVLYIPPAAVGAATILCVIGANTISSRRQAALVSAFGLTEAAFKEYKLKVAEQHGKNKADKVYEGLAQDHLQSDPVSSKEVIITYTGDVLCRDEYSGRYFNSSMESIRTAVNDANFEIINQNYVSLNDFYSMLHLKRTDAGDDLGWNNENKLDLKITTGISDDGRPCLVIEHRNRPTVRYDKAW